MNKEELELVIQAIEKLDAAGQSALTWWLIVNFFSNLIVPTAWVAVIYFILTLMKTMVCYDLQNNK